MAELGSQFAGRQCRLTIAAAFGRDDFESGSDSKSDLVRSGSLFPTSRSLRRRGGGLRAYGVPPLAIAAALGHDGIGSGSDPIPYFVRSKYHFPSTGRCAVMVTACALRAVPANGCCRSGRCPLTFAAALVTTKSGRTTTRFLYSTKRYAVPNFPVAAPSW